MPAITSRVFSTNWSPHRTVRPASSKIIFLSCEGSVTEEEYFSHISELFSEIRSRIQLISVAEDAVSTIPKHRTSEQNLMLSKNRPKQLVERIDRFKEEKNSTYQFSEYPDDEFWIITDVDNNWSNEIIDEGTKKTYKNEWDEAIALCRERNYKYAISNPFFEMWLLLHHDSPTPEDERFAVTAGHAYESTDHFRTRLKDLKAPLRKKKHIDKSAYTYDKVKAAIDRATELHSDKTDLCPHYYATTVYILLNELIKMLPKRD